MKKIVICINFGAQEKEFRVEEEFTEDQFKEFVNRSFPDFCYGKHGKMTAANEDDSDIIMVLEDEAMFSNIDNVTASIVGKEIRIRKAGESIWDGPMICAPRF